MPMVKIRGLVSDHGLSVFQKSRLPRAWMVPNKAHVSTSGGALALVEQPITWLDLDGGSFEVDVYSEPNNPDIWYTLRVDHLAPGQEEEPPERRARAVYEWPQRIYPGEGGNLGEIIAQQVGLALVYAAPDAYKESVWNQIQWNTTTGWVYERVWTP